MTIFTCRSSLRPEQLAAQRTVNAIYSLMIEYYCGIDLDWRRAHRVYAKIEKWGA